MTDWQAKVTADVGDLDADQKETLGQAMPHFVVITYDAEAGTATISFVGAAADAWAAVSAVRDGIETAAAQIGAQIPVRNIVIHPAERSGLALDLVGNAEIGAMEGKDRKWAWEIMSASAAPAPIGATSSGPVYLRTDIQEYLRTRSGRRGRPRKTGQ